MPPSAGCSGPLLRPVLRVLPLFRCLSSDHCPSVPVRSADLVQGDAS